MAKGDMMEGAHMTDKQQEQPNILIVDDTPDNLRLLSSMLSEQGYRIRLAPNGQRALSAIEKVPPDLILLDIMMPDMDGYEVCEKLKANKSTKDIPVIFISALSEEFEKTRAFSSGGVDYVTKPFFEKEVLARIQAHLELKRAREELVTLCNQLTEANEELKSAQDSLVVAATTDPLTGLSNRRRSLEVIEAEMERFKRSSEPFVLVLSDIDNFKHFNDDYGHECGDYVLQNLAAQMKDILRGQDHVGRWGGEEFLMLLPETGLEGGQQAIEKLRESIASCSFEYEGLKLSVTMTFGITQCVRDADVDALLRVADEALYKGKRGTKNCVVIGLFKD